MAGAISCDIALTEKMTVTEPFWWLVNFGLGNGVVPSGNKPLPELMLSKTYAAIWRH